MSDAISGFRDELVDAGRRRQRRRRRERAVAAVATMLLVAVAAFAAIGLRGTPAEAGVEITERNGRVEVRLTDVETRPQVVQDAMRDAGIDATVLGVPVGPSHVGRFVGTITDFRVDATLVDAEGDTFQGFSVPARTGIHLVLQLGRPAEPGEPYVTFSDAYAPGEPLECSGLYGATVSDLVAYASAHPGLDLLVQPFDGAPVGPPIRPAELSGTAQASWLAVDATSLAPNQAVVYLTPDGSPPYLTSQSQGRTPCGG